MREFNVCLVRCDPCPQSSNDGAQISKMWGLLEIAGKRVDLCPYCMATARTALAKRWAFAWPDGARPPNPLEAPPGFLQQERPDAK